MLLSGVPHPLAPHQAPPADPAAVSQAQTVLRGMVLDAVRSPHTRRNYARALDDLFGFAASRPLSRALLMEYRASMDGLAASTINVRLSAVRKMVAEARRNGMIGAEEAATGP
jgi:site-specific recombinase XerC